MTPAAAVANTNNRRDILVAFSRALQRETHVLQDHPDLLWQQMYNRLQWEGEEVGQVMASELARRSTPGARPWLRLNTSHREAQALVRTLTGHTKTVTACALSPDGRLIVSASFDRTLRVWDAASGQTLRTLEGHTNYVNSCAFSPPSRDDHPGSGWFRR